MQHNLFVQANKCLLASSFKQKAKLLIKLQHDWANGLLKLDPIKVSNINLCGIPSKLKLVSSSQLPKRNINSTTGLAALFHSIAHIEFCAINLALDAVCRFQDMPEDYYSDWIIVANDERQHFELIENKLKSLKYNYGDFAAHDGLWRTATETADDVLVRMTLVPRVLEARGLDVSPAIITKLDNINEQEGVKILKHILKEEVNHVAIGTKWFNFLCKLRKLDTSTAFKDIVETRFHGELKAPFNIPLRIAAGFNKHEINYLKNINV